jgi:hypothetical protein
MTTCIGSPWRLSPTATLGRNNQRVDYLEELAGAQEHRSEQLLSSTLRFISPDTAATMRAITVIERISFRASRRGIIGV